MALFDKRHYNVTKFLLIKQ